MENFVLPCMPIFLFCFIFQLTTLKRLAKETSHIVSNLMEGCCHKCLVASLGDNPLCDVVLMLSAWPYLVTSLGDSPLCDVVLMLSAWPYLVASLGDSPLCAVVLMLSAWPYLVASLGDSPLCAVVLMLSAWPYLVTSLGDSPLCAVVLDAICMAVPGYFSRR